MVVELSELVMRPDEATCLGYNVRKGQLILYEFWTNGEVQFWVNQGLFASTAWRKLFMEDEGDILIAPQNYKSAGLREHLTIAKKLDYWHIHARKTVTQKIKAHISLFSAVFDQRWEKAKGTCFLLLL